MHRSQSGDSPPPVLPPRPGTRPTRPPPAAPVDDDSDLEEPDPELYDDFDENSGIPPRSEDVYDDCDEKPAPPLPPHPEQYYDDCEEHKPPPPVQRPPVKHVPPLAAPQQISDDLDSVGPIVQQIPKRQLPPPPPVHSPPANTKKPVEASPYELNDDGDDMEPEQYLPPPPSAHDDPAAIYEVEPEIDMDDALPSPPPPPPVSVVPQLPPKNDRPARLPPQTKKTVTSPGPKSGTPAGGFAIGLGQLQNLKAGLKKVSLDNTSSESSSNNDPKMYGECPHSVSDAKKMFQEKSAGKPGVPKQSSFDKVHNSPSALVQPVKPVQKYEPKQVELEAPEDIYDDASSAVLDPFSAYDWYHGNIDRSTGETRVKAVGKDGTYLVRVSDKDPKFPYTLVLFHKGHVNNLRIRKRADKKVALGDEKSAELAFQDVPAMIEHHKKHNVVLLGNNQSQVKLLHMPPKG